MDARLPPSTRAPNASGAIATPTRQNVELYQEERREIEQIVGEINGMNLVAKEYVAAHVDDDGVLVLSESTGAADELQEALLVNPTRPAGVRRCRRLGEVVPRSTRPLVDHADDSRLLPGVNDALTSLSRLTAVGIVSGRAMESLERLFEFPPELFVIGSHGLELRGSVTPTLDEDEQHRFDQLEVIGSREVTEAGEGEAVKNLATKIDGAQAKPGSSVVELLARTAGKGDAEGSLNG